MNKEPFTELIFLDLKEFKTDRANLRRLEKKISNMKEFSGRKGKVFFFNLNLIQKENFFITVTKALYTLGYKTKVCYQSIEELTL